MFFRIQCYLYQEKGRTAVQTVEKVSPGFWIWRNTTCWKSATKWPLPKLFDIWTNCDHFYFLNLSLQLLIFWDKNVIFRKWVNFPPQKMNLKIWKISNLEMSSGLTGLTCTGWAFMIPWLLEPCQAAGRHIFKSLNLFSLSFVSGSGSIAETCMMI